MQDRCQGSDALSVSDTHDAWLYNIWVRARVQPAEVFNTGSRTP